MVLDAPEVYLSQINASDCTVVHGAIVDDTVCHICGRCPLGGTWNIGRNLAEGKLDAYGYIKVIQYLKTLENGFLCGILWWCRSLVESGTDKAGRGSHISRNSQKAASRTERGYSLSLIHI